MFVNLICYNKARNAEKLYLNNESGYSICSSNNVNENVFS
jgi:hypothetical protein